MFRRLLPVSFVVAAVVAACSGSAGATPVPTAAPTAAATAAAPSVAANGATVSVSPAGYFVGPNGLTLYVFDHDAADTSNCQTGSCLQNWPALTLPAGGQISVGTGLSAADFKTITRQDGSSQVVFKDIPLYYFAGDAAAGDTHGDGVAGIWHLAKTTSTVPVASAPASVPASVPASAPASSTGASGGPCYNSKYVEIPCPSTPGGSPAAGGSTVAVSSAGYLVGSNGFTLYVFDHDTTPDSSACTGSCADNWPALTVASAEDIALGTGLDEDDFTTFTRDDGTMQVEYYGKPLYYFAGDSAAGDTNGNGVSGIWHEAMPQ